MQKLDNKKIKDPVYGYISIPSQYVKYIIDTSIFQRLRRVIQTSYSPLYSSALHNRFVHSIGVFHLGSIVAKQLKRVLVKKQYLDKELAEKYANAYQMACLLHDVGHAPFSHTGEIYYKDENFTSQKLHKRLLELVSSKQLQSDLPGESQTAAPHEIMSAIIGIKEFGVLIGDDESKELFARCITGYTYSDTTVESEIKNCFIGMLNSKVIDVDRMDYLIRDAYTSGFATMTIDYIRLLKAISIVKYEGHLKIAYQKDAVSIIENVVYAHDAEKKWIQNHPVVLYEAYLIKHMLEHLNEKLNKRGHRLFSEESLSKEGHILKNGIKISLMSDDDIIYLSKNIFQDELSEEYFERNKRRHPVWKSEAEYSAYIGGKSKGGEYEDSFMECMKAFNESNIPDHPVPMVINDSLIEKFNKELKEAKESSSDENNISAIKRKIAVCIYLKDYMTKHNLPFDFIVIQTSMFNSNFSKAHLGEVLISFGKSGNPKVKKLKDVCKLLRSESDEKDFYYLFYRRAEPGEKNNGKINDIEKFCSGLYEKAVSSLDEV